MSNHVHVRVIPSHEEDLRAVFKIKYYIPRIQFKAIDTNLSIKIQSIIQNTTNKTPQQITEIL